MFRALLPPGRGRKGEDTVTRFGLELEDEGHARSLLMATDIAREVSGTFTAGSRQEGKRRGDAHGLA